MTFLTKIEKLILFKKTINKILENTVFPLLYDDGRTIVQIDNLQKNKLSDFKQKVESGQYKYVKNDCLCGNRSNEIVVAEKDRFGIPIKYVLCKACSLIRSEKVLDDSSTVQFYENEYHQLYFGTERVTEEYFLRRLSSGLHLVELIRKLGIIDDVKTVFEYGCGSGGVLYPFHLINKTVAGCDFGEMYLKYGKEKGLQLYHGEISDVYTPDNSQDFIILSHVMEHFTNPIEEMNRVFRKIKPGKYCLVEVPGIFRMIRDYYRPYIYFQNAHIFDFNYCWLCTLFQSMNMKVLYGDETCDFILKKPENWKPVLVNSVFDKHLPYVAVEIEYRMIKRHVKTFLIK